MAANPKRKGMSTLPIYLPKVVAARRSQQDSSAEDSNPRLYIERGFNSHAAESLAEGLTKSGGIEANVKGEMISALPRGPQLALRHAVATTARGLACARIRSEKDPSQSDFPLRGAVDQEEATLHAHTHHEYTAKAALPESSDMVYDGESVQATFRALLPEPGAAANIVVTGRMLASWDEGAKMWVPSVVVTGNPILVGMGSGETPPDVETIAAQVREALAQ